MRIKLIFKKKIVIIHPASRELLNEFALNLLTMPSSLESVREDYIEKIKKYLESVVLDFLDEESDIHKYLRNLKDSYKRILAFLSKRIACREKSYLMMKTIANNVNSLQNKGSGRLARDPEIYDLATKTFCEYHTTSDGDHVVFPLLDEATRDGILSMIDDASSEDDLTVEYRQKLSKLNSLIYQWENLLRLIRLSPRNARRARALNMGLEPQEKTRTHLVNSLFVNQGPVLQELIRINEGLENFVNSSKLTAPTSRFLSVEKAELESGEKDLEKAIEFEVLLAAKEEKNRLTREIGRLEALDRNAYKIYWQHGPVNIEAQKKDLRKEIDRLSFLRSFYIEKF